MRRHIFALLLAALLLLTACAAPERPLFVGISDICSDRHNSVEEYYARALERCGHVPFVIPKTADEAALARMAQGAVLLEFAKAETIYEEDAQFKKLFKE